MSHPLARDIVKYLCEKNVNDVADFNWVAQLRYYWRFDEVGKCNVVRPAAAAPPTTPYLFLYIYVYFVPARLQHSCALAINVYIYRENGNYLCQHGVHGSTIRHGVFRKCCPFGGNPTNRSMLQVCTQYICTSI